MTCSYGIGETGLRLMYGGMGCKVSGFGKGDRRVVPLALDF